MGKNTKLIVFILAFAVFIGGAYLLYGKLGSKQNSDRLYTQNHKQPEPVQMEETKPPQAPDFTVYTSDKTPVKLSDFFGKPVVLNFWASWCGPCKMEMPDFENEYLESGDNVNFLMINVTGGRETLQSASDFISQKGYTFPVFYDLDNIAASTYQAYSIPTTYFIGSDGSVVTYAVGAIDAETLQRGIDMITK